MRRWLIVVILGGVTSVSQLCMLDYVFEMIIMGRSPFFIDKYEYIMLDNMPST